MLWLHVMAVVVVSYLLGSVNASILVSRKIFKVDIRAYGSGNAGSTNAFRVMGKKWAIPVVIADLFKGGLAVWFGYCMLVGFDLADLGKLIAGLAVIIGHIFPVFFGFKGGKGVMTTAAVVAFVDPVVFAVVLGAFLVVALATRWVSLGSMVGATAIPVAMYYLHRQQGMETTLFVVLSTLIPIIVIAMHRANIQRIFAGTESRFSFKGKSIMEKIKTGTADVTARTTCTTKRLTAKFDDVCKKTVSLTNATTATLRRSAYRMRMKRRGMAGGN